MFGNWSLRRRLTVTTIALASVITTVIVLIILTTASGFVNERTRDALTALNRGAAASLEGELRGVEAAAHALGSIIDGRSSAIPIFWQSVGYTLGQPDALAARFGVLQPFGSGYVLNLFRTPSALNAVAPRQNETLSALPAELAPITDLNPGDSLWFYSADPYGAVSTPSLIYAARLTGERGYVWSEVPSDRLSARLDLLLSAAAYPYGLTFVDQENLFGAAGMSADEMRESPDMLSALLRDAQAPFSLIENPAYIDHHSAYIIGTPILRPDWRLIGIISEEDISDESDEEVLQIFFVLIIGVIVLGWALDRFSDTAISKPISDLTSTAQEIGSGDMRYQVGYQERGDELGGLARALEDMKLNLSHSYDSLSMWSRTLEKRVTERTQELQVAQAEASTAAAEIRAVYDASLSVVSEYRLNIVLSALTGRVTDLLRGSYCGIWLVTDGRAGLQLVASTSDDAGTIGRVIGVHDGLSGKVIETGEPMIVDDYQHWSGRLGWVAPDIQRALAVPLTYSGQAIGSLVAGRPADALGFSPDDARLLTLLANLVSPVVRSAQLYGQLDIAMHKANSANEVKTRFLASVTHELRTPLNLIINNMDFMRIGTFGDVTDEQRDRLDQTIRSAEHLLYLINDLLDVSKIEAGEMQLYFQPADIRPIIEDALDSALALMTDKPNVALEVDMPDTLPQVTMDARRIRQVLLNLLSNAVKFTPAGEVRLTVSAADECVQFSVTDTGIGIPEGELSKIFEAFERSQRAKEMGIEGTGLGLPISRHLVEAHGGTLTAETEIGKGSTFTVTLPLTPPTTPRPALQLGTALPLESTG